MATVRCDQCGQLALRRRDDRTLHAATREARQAGKFDLEAFEWVPVCCRNVRDFSARIDEVSLPSIFRRVVAEPVDCDLYFPWIDGFTVQDHVRMSIDDRIREQDERRRVQDREWRREDAKHLAILAALIGTVTAVASGVLTGVIVYVLTHR